MDGGRKKPAATALDGGWGWMIVAGCFVVTVCTRAVTRCISIFFVEFQIHFGHDYSRTAWIHSLVDCTTMLCAPLGSFIGMRLSCRIAVILGGFLASAGLVLSSFATSLEYLYLTLGVLTGVGFALCYTPAIAMVGTYFCERKALAYGIAMSGSGIGTFVLAPVVQLLIDHYSWRGALLILGGFVSNLCVCGALLRPLKKGENSENGPATADSEKPLDASAPLGALVSSKDREHSCFCFQSLQEYSFLLMPDFMMLAASFLFLANGCSVPFVYLVPYALSVGVRHQQAAFLMSILGVIDIVGNITFGWLTDRRCLKKYRNVCYMVAVGMEGLCCLFIPLLQSFPLLVPFSVLYGYFDGACICLSVGILCQTEHRYRKRWLHALVIEKYQSWLVDQTGSYMATFFLSGFSLISSSLLLSAVTVIRRCQKTRTYATNADPKLDTCQSTHVDYYKASHEEPKLAANMLSL
ncbi:hypothetical protein AAFF_G00297530 [Aldrovandia affinis]|uniref:Monocarboxylate transporter 12 n=1 Tax=Aldrovandia affinis TaxID=143900 RepID=A0AAD7SRI2_9TELE|nr:hypothetical protein AAFF_G00297530 [Aldrovandia affinis]